MANIELNASMVTNEALNVLVNNLVIARPVNREFQDYYAVEGAKIGDTLSIRKPPRYLGGEGPAITIEDFTETSVALQLDRQPNVGLQFTSKELLLNIDQFSKRVIQPAVAVLANKVDSAVAAQYVNIPYFVGTVGTLPQDLDIYLNAKAQLADNSAPVDDELHLVLTPRMEARIIYVLRTLFQSSERIKEQYEKGVMGYAIGAEWSMDQNLGVQVIGTMGGTGAVNGAGQTGSSIITNGWTASVATLLNVGDIITFAGVNQINIQSHFSTGSLQQFTVTAPASSDSSGNCTIQVSPPLTPAGQYQTVDSTPIAGALISVFGVAAAGQSAISAKSSPQALLYHRDAFTLACADLPLPKNMEMAARAADPQLGMSLRFLRGFDIRTDQFISRLDILFGVATLRPELACRIIA